jgi:hypothetical protein
MDWLIDVERRMKRKNSILFSKDSPFLTDLSDLISRIDHRALVLWALELAEEAAAALLLRYPDETRPQTALLTSGDWAAGRVKMREAQRAILDVHTFAGEIKSPEDIALCRAIGQACGVVHTAGHAMGFPIYELTSIIRRYGLPACREQAEARLRHYLDRLLYWQEHAQNLPRQWAEFMLKG